MSAIFLIYSPLFSFHTLFLLFLDAFYEKTHVGYRCRKERITGVPHVSQTRKCISCNFSFLNIELDAKKTKKNSFLLVCILCVQYIVDLVSYSGLRRWHLVGDGVLKNWRLKLVACQASICNHFKLNKNKKI